MGGRGREAERKRELGVGGRELGGREGEGGRERDTHRNTRPLDREQHLAGVSSIRDGCHEVERPLPHTQLVDIPRKVWIRAFAGVEGPRVIPELLKRSDPACPAPWALRLEPGEDGLYVVLARVVRMGKRFPDCPH